MASSIWKVTILLEIHLFFTEPWLWEEGYMNGWILWSNVDLSNFPVFTLEVKDHKKNSPLELLIVNPY